MHVLDRHEMSDMSPEEFTELVSLSNSWSDLVRHFRWISNTSHMKWNQVNDWIWGVCVYNKRVVKKNVVF